MRRVNYMANNDYSNVPEELRPISMWGYFGYQLLFAIPCVGFIFLCVFALGGAKNVNLKNFARSYFCLLLIGLVISVIVMLLGGGLAALSSVSYY